AAGCCSLPTLRAMQLLRISAAAEWAAAHPAFAAMLRRIEPVDEDRIRRDDAHARHLRVRQLDIVDIPAFAGRALVRAVEPARLHGLARIRRKIDLVLRPAEVAQSGECAVADMDAAQCAALRDRARIAARRREARPVRAVGRYLDDAAVPAL